MPTTCAGCARSPSTTAARTSTRCTGAHAPWPPRSPVGIAVRHEEFDDGHMNITYRYEISLPFLAEAILAEAILAGG